jgi:hypothetical protein
MKFFLQGIQKSSVEKNLNLAFFLLQIHVVDHFLPYSFLFNYIDIYFQKFCFDLS